MQEQKIINTYCGDRTGDTRNGSCLESGTETFCKITQAWEIMMRARLSVWLLRKCQPSGKNSSEWTSQLRVNFKFDSKQEQKKKNSITLTYSLIKINLTEDFYKFIFDSYIFSHTKLHWIDPNNEFKIHVKSKSSFISRRINLGKQLIDTNLECNA